MKGTNRILEELNAYHFSENYQEELSADTASCTVDQNLIDRYKRAKRQVSYVTLYLFQNLRIEPDLIE